MNQIKKRLEIIKIAISMTDTETIRLQMLKLEPFEMTQELQEIFNLLLHKNYAQAQALITAYNAPKNNPKAAEEKKQVVPEKKSIIDEFELLMPQANSQPEEKNIQEEYQPYQQTPIEHQENIPQDTHTKTNLLAYRNILLKEDFDCDINEDMGTQNYPKIVPKETVNEDFMELKLEELKDKKTTFDFNPEKKENDENEIQEEIKSDEEIETQENLDEETLKCEDKEVETQEDSTKEEVEDKEEENNTKETSEETLSDEDENIETQKDINQDNYPIEAEKPLKIISNKVELNHIEIQAEDIFLKTVESQKITNQEPREEKIESQDIKTLQEQSPKETILTLETQNIDISSKENSDTQNTSLNNTKTEKTTKDNNIRSEPITDIDPQYDLLLRTFPPKHPSVIRFQSVRIWLRQISIRGYSNTEIATMAQHIKDLKANQDFAQAAQLTLLASATGSQLGKLIMARELYRGDIFEQNEQEALEMIEQLALIEYPEAICDLGQFYEYGIGTPRDYKMAKSLYEKAFSLGLQRAEKHLDKVIKKSKILPTF